MMEQFYTQHMDIALTKKVSVFDGLVLRERVHESVLHKLIHSDLLVETCHAVTLTMHNNEKEHLMNYRMLIKDDYAYVLYSKKGYGRCVSNGGLSYLNIRRPVRHTLSKGLMVDLDIENCHPVLMVQMLERHGFPCDYLKSFVKDRESWFTIIKKHWQIYDHVPKDEVRDCCKRLFLRIMYGGGYKNWVSAYKLPDNGDIPKQLQGFIDEQVAIKELFTELNPDLKDVIVDKKLSNNGKYANLYGSLCSTVMLEKENTILEIIYLYLRRRGLSDVMSLCADGIMISKEEYRSELLKELEVEVFLQTGFVIKMTQKEMDQGFTDIDAHVTRHTPFVPNSNFKAIDDIVNRGKIMYDDFKLTHYYHESMIVNKICKTSVSMQCSTIKCKLCLVKHVKGSVCHLRINDNGNFVFCCHGNKKVYKKSVKGNALLRAVQTESINNNIDDFFHLDVTGINVVEEDSLFLGCDSDNEIVLKREYWNKFLILNAHMGKGKTSFINTMLKVKACKRILFVSQRKTFTNFICSEFKDYEIVNYLDLKGGNGNYNVDRLCIQVESLHKLTRFDYDVVIVDEVETVLNQFSSTTMKFVRDCWKVLINCIDSCAWCVLADAFVLNRCLDFVRDIKKSTDQVTMLHNVRPYLKGRKCIQISQDKFNGHLISQLQDDKRIVSITGSRNDLIVLEQEVKKLCPGKNIKVYDKDSDKSDLKDVNKVWSECDFVGYTPVVQTGVSYMDKPFDLCYANFKSSNLARDAMQMMMRCRKLNDETVYFSLNKRQIYNTSNITMFTTFAMFADDRYERTHMLIDGLKKDNIKNAELIDMLSKTLETTDKALLKVMWHNLREHMLSQCHYNSMCIYLLRLQGYDVQLLTEEDHNKDRVLEKVDLDYVSKYTDIAIASDEEIELMKSGELHKDRRLGVDKYFFEKMTVGDLPSFIKGKLFFDYYQTSHKKRHLSNIKYEKSDLSQEEMIAKDMEKSDNLISKMSMVGKKLEYMKKFNKLLGLDHSCHTDVVIDKSLITSKVIAYMTKHVKELAILYNSKIKLTGDKRNDNFCALKLLQKIYNDWSGLTFKKCENDKHGRADKYITNCYDYYEYIQPYHTQKDLLDVMSSIDDE